MCQIVCCKMAERNEKWTADQIALLIEAYQEEPCLYATKTPNYHNKNLRAAALQRVSDTVSRLRHPVTPKECSTKFHNLRNQFNIENAKVKASFKSGTGTDNIYTPSLWYYDKLLFLDSYVTLRKSKDSGRIEVLQSDSQSQVTVIDAAIKDSSTDELFENIEYLQEVEKEILLPRCSPTLQPNTAAMNRVRVPLSSPSSSSSSITNCQEESFAFQRPSIVSPVPSTSSSSGVCTTSTRTKKHARLDPHQQEYTRAVEAIAKSMSEPINVNFGGVQSSLMDPDHSFAIFLTSLFRRFKNFDLKMEVMQNVMQTVTNALASDRERSDN